MMRSMRVIYKPVFVVVAVSFIGWLAYGQVTDILGGGRDVVLKVNGQIVRATQFQAALQNAIEESRRRGGGRLSREDEQQLQDQVTDQFIQRILLEREYHRLGIQVSDDEIRQIARSTPPPQILQQIHDSRAGVTDAERERYYTTHRDEFKRPATAWLSYLAQPKVPDAADTAAALTRARRLRAEVAGGAAKFEDVAKKESADSVSGARGGDLGWVKRNEGGVDPQFLAALRRLTPGELGQPALSSFGYHLIRVDAAKGDSLHVRHILIPVVPRGQHLDQLDARTDSLDHLAAEQTDGSRLDSAAQRLHLPVAQASRLIQGDRLTLGRYVISDVSVWAFESRPGETSPVIEGERANYVFRLDSLYAAGTPPLAQVRDRVLAAARSERKQAVARQRAALALAELASAPDLLQAGRARGRPGERLGPFPRRNPPSAIPRERAG